MKVKLYLLTDEVAVYEKKKSDGKCKIATRTSKLMLQAVK